MSQRREYEMSQDDFDGIIKRINDARNTPLIALQCGMPQSPQEAANDAWRDLGKRMGFDGMSVEPGRSQLHFTAIPTSKEATP